MEPKDIAEYLSDDPDILNEAYCSACGGWDRAQMGTGHKLGCPIGKPGTPIAAQDKMTSESGLWICSGRSERGWLDLVYSSIKEEDGVVVSYKADQSISQYGVPTSVYLSAMFDNFKSAEDFQENNFRFNGPLDPAEVVPPEELPELLSRFESGAVDKIFVKEFGLS